MWDRSKQKYWIQCCRNYDIRSCYGDYNRVVCKINKETFWKISSDSDLLYQVCFCENDEELLKLIGEIKE